VHVPDNITGFFALVILILTKRQDCQPALSNRFQKDDSYPRKLVMYIAFFTLLDPLYLWADTSGAVLRDRPSYAAHCRRPRILLADVIRRPSCGWWRSTFYSGRTGCAVRTRYVYSSTLSAQPLS